MECLSRFCVVYPSVRMPRRKNRWVRAKLSDEADPLLQSAIKAASLRLRETHRPDPLFVDPYVGCFVPHNSQVDFNQFSNHYCLATKFIDDKLLSSVNQIDGVKQVVLLTDGMDTRPYRINWPASTIIFDISPERIFRSSAEKLEAVGAKLPRSCLLLNVPMESPDIEQSLRSKGFSGNRLSTWVIQGLPMMSLASFEEILHLVSGLATKGCLWMGEMPEWLADTEIRNESNVKNWMDKLFMSNGFRVNIVSFSHLVRSLGKELSPEDYDNVLFVAEQLRFSDDQMETWRREFQRVEEEGDEEGFEEL